MMAIRKSWQNIHAYIWLVSGLLCLLLAFIFWVMTDSDELVEVGKPIESTTQVQIQPEKVATMTQLGALTKEVRPLNLTSRTVTVGEHEAEFRGTKFIKEQQRQWTIELFRVAEEDIIKSFLQQRPDRKIFVYFRLTGQDQIEQYVLSYGIFQNADAAQKQLDTLNLKLPQSIQPQIRSFADYAPFVNDLGMEEVTINSPLYAVQLKPAALPKEPEPLLDKLKKALSPPENKNLTPDSTTTTTITRRDQEGNVVDVQRSQSQVNSAEKPVMSAEE